MAVFVGLVWISMLVCLKSSLVCYSTFLITLHFIVQKSSDLEKQLESSFHHLCSL